MQLVGKKYFLLLRLSEHCIIFSGTVLRKKKYRHFYNFLSSNSGKFKCIFNIHTDNSIQIVLVAVLFLSASDL